MTHVREKYKVYGDTFRPPEQLVQSNLCQADVRNIWSNQDLGNLGDELMS